MFGPTRKEEKSETPSEREVPGQFNDMPRSCPGGWTVRAPSIPRTRTGAGGWIRPKGRRTPPGKVQPGHRAHVQQPVGRGRKDTSVSVRAGATGAP